MKQSVFALVAIVAMSSATDSAAQRTKRTISGVTVAENTVRPDADHRVRKISPGRVAVIDLGGKVKGEFECFCDPDTNDGACDFKETSGGWTCTGCSDCEMVQRDTGDLRPQFEPSGGGGTPAYRPSSAETVPPRGVTLSENTMRLKPGYRYRAVSGTTKRIVVADVADLEGGQEAHCFCSPTAQGACTWEEIAPGAMTCKGCNDCRVEFTEPEGRRQAPD